MIELWQTWWDKGINRMKRGAWNQTWLTCSMPGSAQVISFSNSAPMVSEPVWMPEGWEVRGEGWAVRGEGWGVRGEGWGVRGEGWGVRGEGWGLPGATCSPAVKGQVNLSKLPALTAHWEDDEAQKAIGVLVAVEYPRGFKIPCTAKHRQIQTMSKLRAIDATVVRSGGQICSSPFIPTIISMGLCKEVRLYCYFSLNLLEAVQRNRV